MFSNIPLQIETFDSHRIKVMGSEEIILILRTQSWDQPFMDIDNVYEKFVFNTFKEFVENHLSY